MLLPRCSFLDILFLSGYCGYPTTAEYLLLHLLPNAQDLNSLPPEFLTDAELMEFFSMNTSYFINFT